jgi:hypothetical protein
MYQEQPSSQTMCSAKARTLRCYFFFFQSPRGTGPNTRVSIGSPLPFTSTTALSPNWISPPSSSFIAARTMPLEAMPHVAFLQGQHHPVVAFDRGTLQPNVVAAPLWPTTTQHHSYLLQRFTSASADATGLPFFLGGGAAPATSTADRKLQFWNFKKERKT